MTSIIVREPWSCDMCEEGATSWYSAAVNVGI